MKLRNKKTGKIVDLIEIVRIDNISNEFYLRLSDNDGRTFKVGFNSLAELNEEWEDYEESKEWYWFIEDNGIIQRSCHYEDLHPTLDKARKEIGNYFNSREEAEKAVEKLEAWRRLKDRRWFRFDGYDVARNSNGDICGQLFYKAGNCCIGDVEKYLDLLFSQEGD